MKTDELRELVGIARLRFEHEQGGMARIVARETRVRRAIAEIDAEFERATTMPDEGLEAMRRLGAQHLWADQARQRRAALIRDLALILAEKTEQKRRLRHRLGQRDALSDIHDDAHRGEMQKRATAREETRVAAQLVKRALEP